MAGVFEAVAIPLLFVDDEEILQFLEMENDEQQHHRHRRQERGEGVPRVRNYVEEIVPRFTGEQFKAHFRMLPEAFEELQNWLAPFLPVPKKVCSRRKILATLWLLATTESYRSVSDRFGMSKGTLHWSVKKVCQVLESQQGHVIRWPQPADLPRLAALWEEKAGFPDVVGAIDGTYIPILGTSDEGREDLICRKGFPAMHLQVVCDTSLALLDVYTGHPGSVHDSRVFRNSDVKNLLESPQGLPPRYHILGDSAYPLKDYLLVPFRDNGHLNHAQNVYNRAHAKTRVHVERAIGLLKGKFRRLKKLDMWLFYEIPLIIFASCVLHNFIILNSGIDEDDIDGEEEDINEGGEDDRQPARTATDKRNAIATILSNRQ